MIPHNISKVDLQKAADKIINESIPKGAHSSTYDVFYNGKLLPPKLIVSYANIFANGEELDRTSFEGGEGTPCFQLLRENGFTIVKKDSVYPHLINFLEQTETDILKTQDYPKTLKGYKMQVSFGKGNKARIPWISFLKPPNTTSHGIYPVYLYFKEQRILILAYGISETNEPNHSWNLTHPTRISDYFKTQNLGAPDRYGASFVYKVYDVENLPAPLILEKDLEHLLSIYSETPVSKKIEHVPKEKMPFDINSFLADLEYSGLLYSSKLINRFVASLGTKPFVILTGLSGSGKTKLAQSFVQWICASSDQYKIIPVGADWTNREPLLGYPNALNPKEYVKPDSGALDIILRALKPENANTPHFLILDEMNLSHVERYFADFLSAMESKESIPLFAEGKVNNGVPSAIKLPPNLFLIGTVNIDETTNMFSPKVLDRANTIEFRVTAEEMMTFLSNSKPIEISVLQGNGASMSESFLELCRKQASVITDAKNIHETLVRFFGELKKTGAEFGYRSASEILRLIEKLGEVDNSLTTEEKLDFAIMQKLLPKLHGSRRKLCPILETLGSFCVTEKLDISKDIFGNKDFNFQEEALVKYPLSLEKISRMYNSAIDHGFASFAEA
ncbi:McrB family protein [Robertkochia sediminum]|uniref:McrB family protein n=1 Tax=Robertkochia sediminum TaxID=2785326 RepID=UPI0019344FB8|nr:DUF3578 domain-containing protein [Robertkochia sediminum]MBL7471358.1 DUF3578 domain-containing protein [Robertkochia sediminum]